MKFICYLIMMCFGFVSAAHAAEFYPGQGLAKLVKQGKTKLGYTNPISCAAHYEPRSGCYQWTPADSEAPSQCYRASLDGLQNNVPAPVQLLIDLPVEGYMMMVNYSSKLGKDIKPNAVKIHENAFYGSVSGLKIDCKPTSEDRFFFDSITSLIPVVLSPTFNLDEAGRPDCLLAEKDTWASDALSGWFNSHHTTQFVCIEAKSLAEADEIAQSYIEAAKFGVSELEQGNKEGVVVSTWVDNHPQWSSATFSQDYLAFTGLGFARFRVTTKSPEEVAEFYAKTGANPEIAPERAAVLFAIEVIYK